MDVVSPVPACGSSFPTTMNPHDASRRVGNKEGHGGPQLQHGGGHLRLTLVLAPVARALLGVEPVGARRVHGQVVPALLPGPRVSYTALPLVAEVQHEGSGEGQLELAGENGVVRPEPRVEVVNRLLLADVPQGIRAQPPVPDLRRRREGRLVPPADERRPPMNTRSSPMPSKSKRLTRVASPLCV